MKDENSKMLCFIPHPLSFILRRYDQHGLEDELSKIRLLMVDDHEIVRAGLRMLLQAQPDMQIVGEVDTGRDAVAKAKELAPDVVLMDISLPDIDGFEATRQIKRALPNVAILALTMHESDEYFFKMLDAGASGYVPKKPRPPTSSLRSGSCAKAACSSIRPSPRRWCAIIWAGRRRTVFAAVSTV